MSLLIQVYLLETYGVRLSMTELAEELGISIHTLRNQVSKGVCPVKTYLDGGQRFAAVEDLAAHVQSCRNRAATGVISRETRRGSR